MGADAHARTTGAEGHRQPGRGGRDAPCGRLRLRQRGLDKSSALCSVEAHEGEPVFTDGPYPETKEHLGGFVVIDVPDDETARHWAGRLAVALDWPQEVHRFPPGPNADGTGGYGRPEQVFEGR